MRQCYRERFRLRPSNSGDKICSEIFKLTVEEYFITMIVKGTFK